MVRAAGAVCGKFYAFFTAKNRQTVGAGTAPLGVGLDTVGWELPVYQAGVQQPLLVVVESRCVGPVLVGLRLGDQNPRRLLVAKLCHFSSAGTTPWIRRRLAPPTSHRSPDQRPDVCCWYQSLPTGEFERYRPLGSCVSTASATFAPPRRRAV